MYHFKSLGLHQLIHLWCWKEKKSCVYFDLWRSSAWVSSIEFAHPLSSIHFLSRSLDCFHWFQRAVRYFLSLWSLQLLQGIFALDFGLQSFNEKNVLQHCHAIFRCKESSNGLQISQLASRSLWAYGWAPRSLSLMWTLIICLNY